MIDFGLALSAFGQYLHLFTAGIAEKNEAFAYIPYTYAKQCITRIVEDMKNMKSRHVRVVGEIDKSYRAIEDETQVGILKYLFCLIAKFLQSCE